MNPVEDCYNVLLKGKKLLLQQTSGEVGKGMEKRELEACIDEYGKDIYSFCRHLAYDRQEAEDLYQDTFLKAVELEGKIDMESNPKSWLLSVALRLWKNRRRKYAWRRRITDICPIVEEKDLETQLSCEEQEASPEERMLGMEERLAVASAVGRLPERLRTAVLLYYMEEQSVKQTARIMGIPPGTVLSRLYKARKILKKELESDLYG